MHGTVRVPCQVARRGGVWAPVLGIFLAACAGAGIRDGAYVDRAKGFAVPLPANGWNVQTDRLSGLLLRHSSRQAGILVHATCGQIPPNRSLEIISRHLFFGLRQAAPLEQERRATAWGDEVEVRLRGQLEGREVLLHGYTRKGGGCVYDLVLFTAPPDYSAVNGDFEALARGFRLEKRTR